MIAQLRKQVEQLQDRAEDTEGRARRNNICIFGMPEGTKGTQPTQFIETWLQLQVAPDVLSAIFTVDRAHQVPTRKPVTGAPPRLSLPKILNFRDMLIRAACEHAPLTVDGARMSISLDYSVAGQRLTVWRRRCSAGPCIGKYWLLFCFYH
ncbi:hypothetical protein NDU88_005055 [Pleurodeles waltl]|uniref:Transposase n=1 Tax=Pleurodeles waltl TaxID=8319 RepID=A0AAV7VM39_PLEWA|nr:hypothetical protein NDU88_005055 [Pleurodeles waltl]